MVHHLNNGDIIASFEDNQLVVLSPCGVIKTLKGKVIINESGIKSVESFTAEHDASLTDIGRLMYEVFQSTNARLRKGL